MIEARAIEHAQREIVNAIKRLGLTPREDELDQLGRAIENAIASATGGGESEAFATLETLRSILRFYPETTTADGRLSISSPSSGTIFIAPTGSVVHRSIHEHVISDIPDVGRTFSTLANKVYHLRQDLSTGAFSLKDLADGDYNSAGVPEGHASFDSDFDDAIHARIVTNSSNVADIAALSNRTSLRAHGEEFFGGNQLAFEDDKLPSAITNFVTKTIDWARTPKTCSMSALNDFAQNAPSGTEANAGVRALSRYSVAVWWQSKASDLAIIGWNAAD
ncbi:MAG: hypothetical protein EA385_01140 [Salinarimonadaceae bacterium]|nr:MAG: hypothetical protein EA385_01140 [Salinarimonadaceae bacterium]